MPFCQRNTFQKIVGGLNFIQAGLKYAKRNAHRGWWNLSIYVLSASVASIVHPGTHITWQRKHIENQRPKSFKMRVELRKLLFPTWENNLEEWRKTFLYFTQVAAPVPVREACLAPPLAHVILLFKAFAVQRHVAWVPANALLQLGCSSAWVSFTLRGWPGRFGASAQVEADSTGTRGICKGTASTRATTRSFAKRHL